MRAGHVGERRYSTSKISPGPLFWNFTEGSGEAPSGIFNLPSSKKETRARREKHILPLFGVTVVYGFLAIFHALGAFGESPAELAPNSGKGLNSRMPWYCIYRMESIA